MVSQISDNLEKIGVVVLNYIKYQETMNCVDSLLDSSFWNNSFSIVIVDNGSGNESVSELRNKYQNIEFIHIIETEKNLGYAKGNNLGIEYLRRMGIDNIFIANSDLVFPGSQMLRELVGEKKEGDALLVPTIKNPNGGLDQRVIYKKKYFFLRMFKELIKSIIKDLLKISSKPNTDYINSQKITEMYSDSYVVSGSGFMLTNYFFEQYSGLFSKTFLYGEECATIILLNKAGLNSKVVNTPPIIHKGGASTPENVKKMSSSRSKINLDSDIKILGLLFSRKNRLLQRS